MQMDIPKSLNSYIENTLLKPDTTFDQIEALCKQSIEHNLFGICVNPAFVKYCKELILGSPLKLVSVIGFPIGMSTPKSKVFETEDAILNGADEIDMVLSIGNLKSQNYSEVVEDIKAVVQIAQDHPVKVIIETALLSESEKIKACELSLIAGASFVKTCTGFFGGGATVEDIKLMRNVVSNRIGIKASGGVKNRTQAVALIKAGADRIGTSSGIEIIKDVENFATGGY